MAASCDNIVNQDESNENALLLIDVINDLEFPGSEKYLPKLQPLADALSETRDLARAKNIPVIYVNDNFNKWRSDFHDLLEHCLNSDVKGKLLAKALKPGAHDYFVLKPMHSGFYCTPLELLLKTLGVQRLIIAGIAANNCVLSTAFDAHMRGFKLAVPSDAVASEEDTDTQFALEQMQKMFGADTRTHKEIFDEL